jgi:NifU-like protein involved in Fe-S cluster formation
MTTALYTPELLGLATSLANFPFDDSLPVQGTIRSRSCGSSVTLGLAIAADGRILRLGLKAQACAIGQSAAALFASGAQGCDAASIAEAERALAKWLSGDGPQPDWPGLGVLAPAVAYPGRHEVIMLTWKVASELLHTAALPG